MKNGALRLLAVTEDRQLAQWIQEWVADIQVTTCANWEAARGLLASGGQFQVLLAEAGVMGEQMVPPFLEDYPEMVRLIVVPADELEKNLPLVAEGRVFALIGRPLRRPEVVQTVQHALSWQRLRGEVGAAGSVSLRQGRGGENPARNTAWFERDLLLMAAHDIRSPLSVIVGYAKYLGEAEQEPAERRQHLASRIYNTGVRLLEMVDHILTVSALESGQQALEMMTTRPSEVLEVVLENLAGMAETNRIALVSELEGGDDLLSMDRFKVVQVLQNLVSNALKFSPAGGRVVVKVATGGPQLIFSVSDTGPGLKPEEAALVFEKFSRFSGTAGQGSGLGLSIAKSLVELHGGEIWVETAPGQGARFFFTIPADPPLD